MRKLGFVACVVVMGCSSSGDKAASLTCGAGTKQVGNECVVDGRDGGVNGGGAGGGGASGGATNGGAAGQGTSGGGGAPAPDASVPDGGQVGDGGRVGAGGDGGGSGDAGPNGVDGGIDTGGVKIGRWLVYSFGGALKAVDTVDFPPKAAVAVPQGWSGPVWSPDGHYLAYTGSSGAALVTDMSGAQPGTPAVLANGSLIVGNIGFAWSKDGKTIGVEMIDGLSVADPSDAAPIADLVSANAKSADWVSDSSGILYIDQTFPTSGIPKESLVFAKIQAFKVLTRTQIEADGVDRAVVSPRGGRIAYLMQDGVWVATISGGVVSGKTLALPFGTNDYLDELRFSPDGRYLLCVIGPRSGYPDGGLAPTRSHLIDTSQVTPGQPTVLDGRSVVFSPSGAWLAFGVNGGGWDLVNGSTLVQTPLPNASSVSSVIFAPLGSQFIERTGGSYPYGIALADVTSPGTPTPVSGTTFASTDALPVFSPDAKTIAYNRGSVLSLRDVSTSVVGTEKPIDGQGSGFQSDTNFAWAPTSSRIAYTYHELFSDYLRLARTQGSSASAGVQVDTYSGSKQTDASFYWQP